MSTLERITRRAPALCLAVLFATAVAGAWPVRALADDVQVEATLDGGIIREGESFNYTIVVSGAMRGSDAPELPELDDFGLVGSSSSSNFSWVNGQASSSKTYRYTLVPLRSGELTIPAVPVRVKGQIYETRAMRVNVRPAASGAPQAGVPPAGHPSAPPVQQESTTAGNRDVFIRSWVDADSVYVGQQLTHHFALYRRPTVSFIGQPQYGAPDFTGFWSEPLGDEISGYRQVDGVNYAATELRAALFPSEPGQLEIGPAQIQLRLRDRSRFEFFAFDAGPEKVLRTPPVPVTVLPLPDAGRPAGFKGTVAQQFSVSLKTDPGPYAVGQPITVTLTLSGLGNPRAFAEPDYDPGVDFKAYDAELQSDTQVDGDAIQVQKRYTRVVVPRREGELSLPGVSYSWFDPDQRRYRSVETKGVTLQVAPGKTEASEPVVFSDLTPDRVELLGRDIHHIKTDPPLAGDGARFPRSAGFWTALALPWPLLAGTWFWRRRRDAQLSDAAGFRARGARKSAEERLRAAEKAHAAGDFGGFCAELASGLRGYLADRLKLSAAGLTGDVAEGALRRAGASDEACTETRRLLDACDFARYAPGAAEHSGARMATLLEQARALLPRLDRETRPARKGAGLLGGLLPLLLLALALAPRPAHAADDTLQRMADAAARYEAGDFQAAAGIWESLAREGVEDSHLWYNLGNAYYQQGDLGRAILDYRRAQRLAPRDSEVRDNLALARSRRPDGDTRSTGGGAWSGAWRWLRQHVSPGELAALGLVLLWLGTALLLLGLLRIVAWRRLRVVLIALAVLLPLVSVAAWAVEWTDWSGREAVLLSPTVSVTSGPGTDFLTLFEIHAGAELRIDETRGNWVRVHLGDELEGWIPQGSFASL